jgi:undecaprenyl-diphosphatase
MHEFIIIVAKYFIILPVVGILVVGFRLPTQEKLKLCSILAIGGVITLALSRIGSHLYHDPRPFVVGHFTPLIPHAHDNGFPSDHTLASAFLAYTALYFSKNIGWVMVTIALLIGVARVLAGVHHVIDVIGGFIIAGLGCYLAIISMNYFTSKKKLAR